MIPIPDLHEVIEVLARAAAHSPTWSQADSDLVSEWIEDEKPAAPKPTLKTGANK